MTDTIIMPEPRSRLDQLAAEYAALKPAVDQAVKQLKEVTDAIKVELTNAAPDSTDTELRAAALETPLRMFAKTSRRLDTKRLAADLPEIYDHYARQQTVWELRST